MRANVTKYRYPTAEELYAYEVAARRLRAKAVAEALRSASAGLKSACSRAMTVISTKVVRHA